MLVFDFGICNYEGDSGRWTRSIDTISQLKNRYFLTLWIQGLTETQGNEFYNRPMEVKPVTYIQTRTLTDYIPIELDSKMYIKEHKNG